VSTLHIKFGDQIALHLSVYRNTKSRNADNANVGVSIWKKIYNCCHFFELRVDASWSIRRRTPPRPTQQLIKLLDEEIIAGDDLEKEGNFTVTRN